MLDMIITYASQRVRDGIPAGAEQVEKVWLIGREFPPWLVVEERSLS